MALPQALPDSLRFEARGDVGLLTLCRAEKRNALNDATIEGIARFFAAPPAGIHAVVINAEGPHFSAGLDLSAVLDKPASEAVRHSRSWHRAFDLIEHGEIPVIAVLHGAVVGGGLELASACHIRVAEKSSYYALPEGRHGIFVGGGGSVRVTRLIGLARMTDMMLAGRTYAAADGVAAGFSQYLAEAGEGLAMGLEIAQRIAANAPLTNYAVLQALPRIAAAPGETGFMMEALMAAIASSDDAAKIRIRTFLEGRGTKVRNG